ncbi:hypothetical protein BX666DRAFT_2032142 [Dichotomocladium elegans]|nr:hypothetical protein BX666DRAFT_2032142 [Dichotomocladium elegans]
MVDVVGFSRLTSQATEKGQSGAEALALEIGAYLGECIQIVEFYGGDVVKFLGDAVLVSFQPSLSDAALTEGNTREDDIPMNQGEEAIYADGSNNMTTRNLTVRQKSVIVRRAIECGQQLLARLSHYRVYLTAEERAKHRTATGEINRQQVRSIKAQRFVLFDGQSSGDGGSSSNNSESSAMLHYPSAGPSTPSGPDSISIIEYPEEYSMAFDALSCLPLLRCKGHQSKRKKSSRVYAHRPSDATNMVNSDSTSIKNVVDLELHIAMSCGDVTNVILGEQTAPTENSSNSKSRHHTLSPYSTSLNGQNSKRRSAEELTTVDKHFLDYAGRLEYAICGPAVEQLEDALSAAKGGEMSITPEVHRLVYNQSLDYVYEKRKRIYIVRGREHEDHNKRIARHNTAAATYLSNHPELKRQASKLSIEPLVPRTRHKEFRELSNDPNPNYFKYVNRSALYRLQRSPDGNFPAQFREVTVMFVSLGRLNVATPRGLHIAQKAVTCAIRILVKYEGMIQQFAVDDKGPTILAVFGLPPLSHEREALFAAKAAVELRNAYRHFKLADFSIALSTGTIFNAVLPQGNPYRRDPSICGDAIVLAVRMLKFGFAKKNVVCDTATRQQIGGLCDFEDMGQNFVKGRVKPVQMYSITKFGQSGQPKRISLQEYSEGGNSGEATNNNGGGSSSDFIGYKAELDRATQLIADWNGAQNHHVMVISGPSGAGKSFFCHVINRMLSSEDVITCWCSSAEVERSSKYCLIRNPLLALFDLIITDKIEQNQRHQSFPPQMMGCPLPPTLNAGDRTSTLSQISSVSNRESLGRIGSYSSAHRTSGPVGNEANNELVEQINKCLAKCGEDESLLPLFKAVFPLLGEVRENKYIARLDGRARDILLIGVIMRMVRYVSEQMGVVFICDDVQWADPASIRVLYHIHEQCQRVMIIMATRPPRDYNVGFLSDFYKLGSHEEITLNGLGAEEIGEIILHTFQNGVRRVSPEIVRVFQKRTGGNPLYVKNMALVLKDFKSHVTVMDSELVTSSSEFDLDDLLVNFDYKRIIMMQYDRLEASFQEFLTVASCLDQYFTIEEVAAVINDNPIFQQQEMEDIRNLIQVYDIYQFLNQIDGPTLHEEMTMYTFAHITTPESIYSMVPYETRVDFHQRLARFYESRLNRDNYSDLLPKVTRHYMKTDALAKQLVYLELLADLNMKSYFLPEATDNLTAIVKILDDNEAIAEHYGRIHRSDIYRRLGICYTMRTKLNEGEEYLFLALDALGEPWPATEPKFLFKLYLNRLIQYQHRRMGPLTRYTSSTKRLIWRRVVDIMIQLSNIYFYKGKGRAFVYTCLVGLNACERLGDCSPSSYNLFLTRNSLLCWINDQKEHSIFYITKALKQQRPTDKGDPGTLTTCAMLCFAAGKFANARDLLRESIRAVEAFGVITDCQAFYRSVGLMITMRIFENTLNNSPDDMMLLKRMANTAHANGDYEAETWLGVYNIANAIIMDRLFDCEAYVAMLEARAHSAADYNKIAIHGTLVCYYARLSNFVFAKQHLKQLVNALPSLTVTPNIFPIFGLIFATMGMYLMIEDAEVDLIPAEDERSYDQFNLGVSRINHAFQQVKFWEFTQPCLYLARALPYISTGRTVEGYLVLRHGIFEMHFIQEITFLKAYYWANLGKYAFTPADRIEWTERARIDLDRLEIPSHVYCNPDPSNCYSSGHKADLRA